MLKDEQLFLSVRLPGPKECTWDVHTDLVGCLPQRFYEHTSSEAPEVACFTLYWGC